jgi:hypothetical protein
MKKRLLFISLLLLTLILAACGGGAAPSAPQNYQEEPSAYEAPAIAPEVGAVPPVEQESKTGNDANAQPGGVVYDTGAPASDIPAYQRMVIKNAEITLLVKSSEVAIDGVTQLVGDVRGYIVSSQFWYQDYNGESYQYATITIGIPADQFEAVLRRLRNLSIRVVNETASGQDVTDQYVDLQSQLTNLEATRDRIKSFLDQATTVDEALHINQQLSEIEAQIEQVKGQMNYLSDRSAFSTITITINPDLPPIPPTMTPTPIPTATPVSWDPGQTIDQSTHTLKVAYQGIIDFLIWFFLVLVPILLPPVAIIWFFLWLIRRATRGKPKA